MTSVICTLFEGNYHFGLAALVNSLFHQGYKGEIFAGYRGALPTWAHQAKINEALNWQGATSLDLDSQIRLHLLPLATDYHFTNYKPDFILELWNGPAKKAQNIFYLDPDIVVSVKWDMFEQWVTCGVALCEDVNSPLPKNFPRRVAWRNFFATHDLKLSFRESFYVNGGFVGVNSAQRGFVDIWKRMQELMADQIGGLNRSSIMGAQIADHAKGVFAPFGRTDQDALNAAVEAFDGPVSIVGKEAMGFISGEAMLPHALGQPKPWNASSFSRIIAGIPPRQIDKQYWTYANGPITTTSKARIYRKKLVLRLSALFGRLYRRN